MAWSVVSEWWLHAMARHEGVLVIALWPAVAMHWQRASATSVHFGGDNLLLGKQIRRQTARRKAAAGVGFTYLLWCA